MTASSKKPRPTWQDRLPRDAEEEDEDSEDEDKAQIKESQNEWTIIEREAREEIRLKYAERSFTQGRRDGEIAAYDDAVSDEEEPAPERPPPAEAARRQDDDGDVDRPRDRSVSPPAPGFRAGGAAGAAGDRTRTRGGRKPGSKKRKKDDGEEEAEEGEEKEKKKKRRKDGDEEADPDRWVKLRLQGEDTSKRIDATRVVSYFDFDSGGDLFRDEVTGEVVPEARAEPAPAPEGNFRAQASALRDMWGDDSDEEDGPP